KKGKSTTEEASGAQQQPTAGPSSQPAPSSQLPADSAQPQLAAGSQQQQRGPERKQQGPSQRPSEEREVGPARGYGRGQRPRQSEQPVGQPPEPQQARGPQRPHPQTGARQAQQSPVEPVKESTPTPQFVQPPQQGARGRQAPPYRTGRPGKGQGTRKISTKPIRATGWAASTSPASMGSTRTTSKEGTPGSTATTSICPAPLHSLSNHHNSLVNRSMHKELGVNKHPQQGRKALGVILPKQLSNGNSLCQVSDNRGHQVSSNRCDQAFSNRRPWLGHLRRHGLVFSSHNPNQVRLNISRHMLVLAGNETLRLLRCQRKNSRRGRGKGRGQGRQETLPHTSGSQQIPSRELSKMQISGSGQGDTALLPMEYIRAKPGVKGRKIIVETNHIPLNLGKLRSAVHYDVKLVPDVPKKYLRTVVEQFRLKHFPKRYPAFDGRKNLYSPSPLPFNDAISDTIIIQENDGREKKFEVEIKFANNVDLTPLHDLLTSMATPREALQVVDIVMRSAPASRCISAGRSFFTKPDALQDLGEGMEMYNGFYQSTTRGWKPFLNVDVAHKAFPKKMNVIELLLEICDSYYQGLRREDLKKPLNRDHEETLAKYIKTLKVLYEIPGHPSSKRVYRVNGLGEAPRDKVFQLDNGTSTTVEKYFATTKNYRINYPLLPTLWVGSQKAEKKVLVPLELCTVETGQVLNRKMTENQTSKMIRYAATNTTIRKQKIVTALRDTQHNRHPSVQEFGFTLGSAFEKVDARVLEPPVLSYDRKTVVPRMGVWRGDRFLKGAIINRWTIICVQSRVRPDDITKLADAIYNNAGPIGINITSPATQPFQTVKCFSVGDMQSYFSRQVDKKYDLIFVIVPNSGKQYSYVKTAAELNVGCLTQCVKVRTLGKMNTTTAVNILLKVNSKLNGTNHCLNTPPSIMTKNCIIMGADVTHPSPDSQNIPSVAAITASHDQLAFQYNICWRLQSPKVEIIEDLEAVVMEQLRYYEKMNKVLPDRIIFFRDGVSEGQFDQVRSSEIRAIRSGCNRLSQGYKPKIAFLVVQKRHHTRLFPTNPKDSQDRNLNVPAGTCVDSVITHPFMQDFYLVSHASIQGVAKPTKYCTLWDDIGMSNDDIEELTYFLCHMFTRCTRSVSYPAPTYYAHLAAARAKVYIENERLDMDHLSRECDRFKIKDEIRKNLPMFFV
ncbi:hypothetical protein NQ318_001410, partial [Aromia moschata]